MNKYLLIFTIFAIKCSYSQSIEKKVYNCKESFYVMYGDTTIDENLQDCCFISFDEGFNDTLEVFFNNRLVNRDFYKTNPSIGTTAKNITCYISDSCKANVLLIKNITDQRCLEFVIDTRYRIIGIDFAEEKWGVYYTNRFTMYE